MRTALASHDITTVFTLLRRHGMSQRRIGALTGQAQPEISAITRGRHVVSYDVLSRIADGLGIPRGLMGLAYTPTDPPPREAAPTMPDRREFMGLLAKITMGATLTTADLALLATPAVATPTPSRIGTTEVDQLRELTRVLWTQEKQLGGGAVRDAVLAQLGWARSLLTTTHTDEVGHQLRAVLSDLLALAGWSSYDVGLIGPALRYTGQALGRVSDVAEPDVDAGDGDGGGVAQGEFVVAGSYCAVLFEQVDAAFHGVALLVDLGVERGWPSAVGAFVLAVGGLVTGLCDGGLDPASTQVGPVGPRGVGLVRQHTVRAGPGSTGTGPGHPDRLDHRREPGAVTTLPGSDQQ